MVNLIMVRENGAPVPQYNLPEGYEIQPLGVDEGIKWEQVLLDAGFSRQDIGGVFDKEFAPHSEEFDRVLMLKDCKTGQYIGTISAWFNDQWHGGGWGQIHWVGLSNAYQGRGLAKPLMSAAMNMLVARHEHSFLVTQPIRSKAIQMYLSYGFEPYVCSQEEAEGWKEVEAALGKEIKLNWV